jgi:hypothetical protein
MNAFTSYLPASAAGISTFPHLGGCCSIKGPVPPLLKIRAECFRTNYSSKIVIQVFLLKICNRIPKFGSIARRVYLMGVGCQVKIKTNSPVVPAFQECDSQRLHR